VNVKIPVYAIVFGVVITLLTGLVNTTPPIIGAVWYGFPLAWLVRLVVAPEYFPWQINFTNLIIDIVFWATILGAILFLVIFVKTVKK
jgi:hypothetical protein